MIIIIITIEKCYYMSILLKAFIRTAKRIHSELFNRDGNCGILVSSCSSLGFSPGQQI